MKKVIPMSRFRRELNQWSRRISIGESIYVSVNNEVRGVMLAPEEYEWMKEILEQREALKELAKIAQEHDMD